MNMLDNVCRWLRKDQGGASSTDWFKERSRCGGELLHAACAASSAGSRCPKAQYMCKLCVWALAPAYSGVQLFKLCRATRSPGADTAGAERLSGT